MAISPAPSGGNPLTDPGIASLLAPISGDEQASGGAPAAGGSVNAPAILSQVGASLSDASRATNAGWAAGASGGVGAQQVAAGQNALAASNLEVLLKRKQQEALVYNMYGTNPDAPTQVAILAKATADLTGEFLDRQKMITAKRNQDFLDNPIQWLINQVTLPFDEEAANSVYGNITKELDIIHRLNAATKEGVEAASAAAYNTSTGALAATSMINLGQAQEKAAEFTFNAARVGLTGAGTTTQIAATGFNAGMDVARLGLSYKQYTSQTALDTDRLALAKLSFETSTDLDRQRMGQSREQFEINKNLELARMNLEERRLSFARESTSFSQTMQTEEAMRQTANDKFQQDQILLSSQRAAEHHAVEMDVLKLQNGLEGEKAYARADLDKRLAQAGVMVGVKAPTYLELSMMADSTVKKTWLGLIEQPDIQMGRYGNTPGEAIDSIRTLRAKLEPGSGALYNKITSIAEAELSKLGPAAKAFTPEQLSIAKNTAIQRAILSELGNIADSGSVYSPTSLAATLLLPEVASTSLASPLAVIANRSAEKSNPVPTSAADILAAAKARLLDTTTGYTPEMAAAEVAQIFKAVGAQTDRIRQFHKFALPSIGDAGQYRVQVEDPTAAYGKRTFDVANPVVMETYFTRWMIRNSINSTTPGVSP